MARPRAVITRLRGRIPDRELLPYQRTGRHSGATIGHGSLPSGCGVRRRMMAS